MSSTQPDKRVLELHRRLHTPVERPKDGHGVIVQRMLHGLMEGRDPTLRRSRSTGSVPRKAQQARDKKPGHCENCRCRFDDFYEHTRSRRHRKFALDESTSSASTNCCSAYSANRRGYRNGATTPTTAYPRTTHIIPLLESC